MTNKETLNLFPHLQSKRAALWDFGQLFPSSEFSDNPGQSLIQSAEYLLSWCRKGRYPRVLHRKSRQTYDLPPLPCIPRISGRDVPSGQTGSPEPRLLLEKMVSIALRDQLIKSIIFQFGEPCRESLFNRYETRQKKQAGRKKRGGRESENKRLPPLKAKRETTGWSEYFKNCWSTGILTHNHL